MKNIITTFAFALTLGTTFAIANNSNEDSKLALPVSSSVIETPAPQALELVTGYSKYTPAQKASIVELKVVKNETTADSKIVLPASTPTLETPAPQSAKTVNEYAKYTPTQKAAIVELKVAK